MIILLQRASPARDKRWGSQSVRWATVEERSTSNVNWAVLIGQVASRKDREAFRTLFTFFAPRIKSFLIRTGSTPVEAEEIAQDTMIAVWRKAEQFDPATTGVAAWIFTIARNLRIDALRKDQRSERMLREVEHEYTPAAVEGAEASIARQQDATRVESALCQLSPEQSEVIKLSFIHGKPHAEIAAFLDIPLGTVKSRVRLAMNRLRELLDDTHEN